MTVFFLSYSKFVLAKCQIVKNSVVKLTECLHFSRNSDDLNTKCQTTVYFDKKVRNNLCVSAKRTIFAPE